MGRSRRCPPGAVAGTGFTGIPALGGISNIYLQFGELLG